MIKRYNYLFFALIFCSIAVLGFTENVRAQRTVIVEPGPLPPEVGLLNRAILADTTSTGARVDSNTVYVLRRDAFYLLDDSFRNGFPLTIVAEDGEGERPFVGPGFINGGSARPFRPAADLTLRGIKVSNQDNTGGVNTNMIRVDGDNLRIVVDDCHLDIDGQAMFRLDGSGSKIWLLNSIVSNSRNFDSPGNGRCIDTRGNDSDTLVVENCTIYNLTNEVLRGAGAAISYVKINHNTIVNTGELVNFSKTAEAIFTNNLVINAQFYGVPPSSSGFWVSMDSLDVAPETQAADIRNNNFFTAQNVSDALPDTVTPAPLFNPSAQIFVDAAGTGNTMIEEGVTFTDGPPDPVNVITSFYDQNATNEAFDVSGEPYDFAYPTDATSYTASTAGQPLGALTWFGIDIISSVGEPVGGEIPTIFGLLNNYPNPFNPNTTIMYTLPKASPVTLTIYNTLGQKIATLVNGERHEASTYRVQWNGLDDAGRRVSSGVYFYRLEADDFIQTNKMLMVK